MNASVSLLLCMTVLFGCASQEENQQSARELSRESEKEVRAYLENAQLEEVFYLRYKDSLQWDYLNDYFVIVKTNKDDYLLEMKFECGDLRSNEFYASMMDRRSRRDIVRAGQDTIRGCRIKTIYVLPEVDGSSEPTGDPDAPQQQ